MGKYGVLAVLLLALPLGAFGQEPLDNAGFVQNTIWFSEDPFFAGDAVRMYTAVFNSTPHDLKGTVEFLVDGTGAGAADFTATGSGGAGIAWVDWTAEYGSHSFAAAITEARVSIVGKGEQAVVLAVSSLQGPTRLVDEDTDGDGVGNKEDGDDDGDGLSDAQEEKLQTNSLSADTDGDGLSDKEDPEPLAAQEPEEEEQEERGLALLESERFSGVLVPLQKAAGAVVGATEGIRGKIDEFAASQAVALQGGRLFYGSKIAESALSPERESFAERAGGYAALAAVSFSSFVFENPLFLYVLILALLVMIVRRIWNRMFIR